MPRSCKPVDQLLQIEELVGIAGRMDQHMAGVGDGKITLAPTRHFVQFRGIGRCPTTDLLVKHLQGFSTGTRGGKSQPSDSC